MPRGGVDGEEGEGGGGRWSCMVGYVRSGGHGRGVRCSSGSKSSVEPRLMNCLHEHSYAPAAATGASAAGAGAAAVGAAVGRLSLPVSSSCLNASKAALSSTDRATSSPT